MKIRPSFLLSLATVLILIPAEILACACCAERGHYSSETVKPDQYVMDILRTLRFSDPELYITVGMEDEDIRGLSSVSEAYRLMGRLEDRSWKLNFSDARGKSGTLVLPVPDKITDFRVDIHDGKDGGAGSPLLYKEWQIRGSLKQADGIFQPSGSGNNYFLLLQGRGNACTNAADFKNWRLEITGKNAGYTFFGSLTTGPDAAVDQKNFLVTPNGAGGIRLGITVAEARKAARDKAFIRSSDGEGIALIDIMQNDKTLISVYAGEENSEAPIDDTARIEFIEVWQPQFKTVAGVHPQMLLSQAEQIYGKVQSITMSEIESRETVVFANHPAGLTFLITGNDSTAGDYEDGNNKTDRYTPGAYIRSIQIYGK